MSIIHKPVRTRTRGSDGLTWQFRGFGLFRGFPGFGGDVIGDAVAMFIAVASRFTGFGFVREVGLGGFRGGVVLALFLYGDHVFFGVDRDVGLLQLLFHFFFTFLFFLSHFYFLFQIGC